MSSWNDCALVSLKEDLKLNVLLGTGLMDKLEKAAGGFMNRNEAQAVEGKSNNTERMDCVIAILRGKGDDDFQSFC